MKRILKGNLEVEAVSRTMKDTGENRHNSNNLRKRAEAFLEKTPSAIKKLPVKDIKDMKALIEELQIHQVELEMQREELRRSQAELEEARDRYLNLYDSAPVGYLTVSEKGIILDANLLAITLLGVERSTLFGMPFFRLITQKDQDLFYFHRNKLLESRERETCELRLVKKDGCEFYAKLESIYVENSDEDSGEFYISMSDIDEQKKAAESLRASEERHRMMFEHMNSGVAVYETQDDGGTFVFKDVNPAAEKISNIEKEKTIGRELLELFPKMDRFGLMDALKRVWKTGQNERLHAGYYRDDLRQGWRDNRIYKLPSGEVVAIYDDVTEIKEAEQKLKQSEEKYRSLVEEINDIIYSTDVKGVVTYISPTVEKLMGYGTSEIIGRNFIEFVHPDDRHKILERFNEIQESEILHPYEYRLLSKSGDAHWIRSSSRLMYKNEQVVGLRGVFTDITQSKRLEEQLRQTQKMEAIGTLSGGIAHDYNNLLAVIMGNLSIVQEETEPHSLTAELLQEIEQASYKARDLTHQFLTLSQGGHPRKEPGSIRRLLKEIPEQIQAHEGIEYAFSIQDDLWSMEYDSKQMHYTINNLIINAVEAMPQGGTVTIQAENKVVLKQDKGASLPLEEGKYVRVSIKDEGRGIPKEHMDRIFDPYFSTKERGAQKGMGLGLTTAYAVVEKHGGHLVVDSTTGVGTTVSIYLPAGEKKGKGQTPEPESECETLPGSKDQTSAKKILIMDDEESLRNLAEKMLIRLGYDVKTAKDGNGAINLYKKCIDSRNPFDGVILDLTIKGGMGGEQAIKALVKIDPGVKAIVCSGYFNDPVMADYKEYGFRGAMAKPYQKADLESVLKKVLG